MSVRPVPSTCAKGFYCLYLLLCLNFNLKTNGLLISKRLAADINCISYVYVF